MSKKAKLSSLCCVVALLITTLFVLQKKSSPNLALTRRIATDQNTESSEVVFHYLLVPETIKLSKEFPQKLFIVYLGGEWCGKCVAIKKDLLSQKDEIAQELSRVYWVSIDVSAKAFSKDKEESVYDWLEAQGIPIAKHIPFMVAFKNGIAVGGYDGSQSRGIDRILDFLQKAQLLDIAGHENEYEFRKEYCENFWARSSEGCLFYKKKLNEVPKPIVESSPTDDETIAD